MRLASCFFFDVVYDAEMFRRHFDYAMMLMPFQKDFHFLSYSCCSLIVISSLSLLSATACCFARQLYYTHGYDIRLCCERYYADTFSVIICALRCRFHFRFSLMPPRLLPLTFTPYATAIVITSCRYFDAFHFLLSWLSYSFLLSR